MSPQSHPYHQSLEKKYRKLYRRIYLAIRNGRFYSYSSKRQKHLIHLLNRYARRLATGFGTRIVLGSLTSGMLLSSVITAQDQSFTLSPDLKPFGLTDIGLSTAPTFVDIDADGDFDAFVGELNGQTRFFENTGADTAPAFALSPATAPFGLTESGLVPAPRFVDIDGDGDFDAFIGNLLGDMYFFENTGSSNSPAFSLSSSTAPFGLATELTQVAFSFADIDGDGDMDAFLGDNTGNTRFFENTGSSTNAAFDTAVTNSPFGITDVGVGANPNLLDIDSDGDLDAIIGNEAGETKFFRNIGNSNAPSFVPALLAFDNPLGLSVVGTQARSTFVDIDGDGDLDAFIGEFFGNINFFSGNGGVADFYNPDPFVFANVKGVSSPSLIDIDGDGDLDAFIGALYGECNFFENTGSSSTPAFTLSTSSAPFGITSIGQDASPTFIDIDGDGDFDAFVGGYFGMTFFENTGSPTAPAFIRSASSSPFGLSHEGYNAVPTFVDVDGDGDFDAFVGLKEGNVNFFINIGSTRAPSFLLSASSAPYGLSDVGNISKPTFVDIDGDGDFDAFVGEYEGNINFFENTGSSSAPAFSLSGSSSPFGISDVGDFSRPTFADIDGDGDSDAIVGRRGGNLIFFENSGSSSAPSFFLPGSDAQFGITELGSRSAPSFVDIDGDGDFDALVGEFQGNINLFVNIGSNSAPSFFLSGSSAPYGITDIGIESKPTFVDIDGDGDYDAFVGERDGATIFFENTGSSSAPAFGHLPGLPSSILDVGTDSAPAFADIDGDGDFDAFIGEYDGIVNFFENTGSSSIPVFILTPIMGLSYFDIGRNATPSIIDIDGDGDYDVLVGERDGGINLFENTGSSSNPAFSRSNSFSPFGFSDVGSLSTPSFVDIDGDGDFDAFIGEVSGITNFFENKPCVANPIKNHVQKHQNEFLGKETINSSAVVRPGRSVHFSGQGGIIFNEAFEVKANAQLVADNEGCKN